MYCNWKSLFKIGNTIFISFSFKTNYLFWTDATLNCIIIKKSVLYTNSLESELCWIIQSKINVCRAQCTHATQYFSFLYIHGISQKENQRTVSWLTSTSNHWFCDWAMRNLQKMFILKTKWSILLLVLSFFRPTFLCPIFFWVSHVYWSFCQFLRSLWM